MANILLALQLLEELIKAIESIGSAVKSAHKAGVDLTDAQLAGLVSQANAATTGIISSPPTVVPVKK